MNKKKELLADPLSLKEFYSSIPNIDRACSTLLENSIGIFLPHKRLDKSHIQAKFYEDNQNLVLKSDLYEKVELKGRLLCQTHKDILEVLLTSKKVWLEDLKTFQVKISAYQIFKKLGKSSGNNKWLEQKLNEISESKVKIVFDSEEENSFLFGFIDSVSKQDKCFSINFTSSYSHLMAKNEMLDYSNYVEDILALDNHFAKAVVRYMLTHNGNDSKITIENLVEKLNLNKVISKKQLAKDIKYIKEEKTQNILKEVFGIELKNNDKTLTFNTPNNKQHYYLQ